MSEEPSKKRKKGSGWLGILFFLLLFIGPSISRPLSNFLANASGGALIISPDTLLFASFALLMILSILSSVIGKMQDSGNATSSIPSFDDPSSSSSSWPSSSSSSSSSWPSSSSSSWGGEPSTVPTDAANTFDFSSIIDRLSDAAPEAKPQKSGWSGSAFSSQSAARSSTAWEDEDEEEVFSWGNASYLDSLPKSQRSPHLPPPPRFESTINGKVLGCGLALVMLIGGVLVSVFF